MYSFPSFYSIWVPLYLYEYKKGNYVYASDVFSDLDFTLSIMQITFDVILFHQVS